MLACISLCRHFTRTQWELPVDGPRLLITWRESPAVAPGDGDEAISGALRAVLCQSMTRDHEVAWFDGVIHPDAKNHLLTPGFLEWPNRIRRYLTRRPRDAWLLRSRDLSTVLRLFDATGFSWDQRGQMVLLFPPAASIDPEPAQLLAAIGTLQRGPLETFWPLGVAYCILPGVDGCVAGVYASDWNAIDAFIASLEAAAATSGVRLSECNEESLSG